MALVFYGGSAQEPLRWLVGPIGLVGLAWITAQLYVYPLLLQRPESRPWEIMREALLMALGYPLSSLSLLLTVLVLFDWRRCSGRSGPFRLLLGNCHAADGGFAADRDPAWRAGRGCTVSDQVRTEGPGGDRLRQRRPRRQALVSRL